MANYHFVYKDVEGASTQWDNIQRKLGNLPPKPPAFKPPSFKPATATATTTDDYNYLIQNQKMLSQDLPQLTMELNRLENIRSYAGAVEYKLFVGSLNKQATEKEVEEIFSPYGRVEDVYLMRDEMKQSRGCGFVKFSSREMAMAAINGLSGIYTMKGCDQPLTVRFADPKRPRAGESRGGTAFGGPGFGPRFQPPGLRPTTNLGEPMHGRIPPNAWHPMSPQNMGPSLNAGMQGFGSQLLPRSGDLAMPSTLQTVWASDNELTGSIPEFIGNWSKLKSLFLGNNKLTGILPAQKSTPLLNMIKDGNAERIGGSLTTG